MKMGTDFVVFSEGEVAEGGVFPVGGMFDWTDWRMIECFIVLWLGYWLNLDL